MTNTTIDYYYNAGWQVVEERRAVGAGSAQVHIQYLWCPSYIDTPVLRWRDTSEVPNQTLNETLYYTVDANKNVTALITPNGQVVERYLYDPYGRVMFLKPDWLPQEVTGHADGTASAFGNEILFTGYRYNPETGYYQVRHREFNLLIGRFMQRDPLGYVDGGNLYAAYMIMWGGVDPEGLRSVDLVTYVHWETHRKTVGWASPDWRPSFWTKNRARFDVTDCCKINPLPDSDESLAAYRIRARMAGEWARWSRDFSGDTKAKYWKASLECDCGGEEVDGLFIEVWHVFSTAEAAEVTLKGGLEVEFGVKGAKAKGVLGGEIKFAKSTELSRAKWLFLACPRRDDTHYWAEVRLITEPNNSMTHKLHRLVLPWSVLGWTTENIQP